MTWVPGFNHPPCDLTEATQSLQCIEDCRKLSDYLSRQIRCASAFSWRAKCTAAQPDLK